MFLAASGSVYPGQYKEMHFVFFRLRIQVCGESCSLKASTNGTGRPPSLLIAAVFLEPLRLSETLFPRSVNLSLQMGGSKRHTVDLSPCLLWDHLLKERDVTGPWERAPLVGWRAHAELKVVVWSVCS